MTVWTELPDYTAAGGASQLFRCNDREVLIEGPAGTGKTRACLEYINYLCEAHPGIRVLIVRKTRKSLSESVLVTFEEHVLGEGHPAIVGDARRQNRDFYRYPNGSHIAVGGLDNPDRIMSTDYDLVYVAEATEATLDDWEKLNSRVRNKMMPYLQAVADCNPGSQFHWLNQRANQGKMTRIFSRHEDNPHVDEPYLERLRDLTGARRDRLYLGVWVSEEGLVYDNFDPRRHVVEWSPELHAKLRWYFGAVDWGYRNPGCFQVWGVDGDDNMYRVAEIYQSLKQLDWWAAEICELDREYSLEAIVADPAEPRSIDFLNDRISARRGRHMAHIVRKADNRQRSASEDQRVGIDMVRWALGERDDSAPPRMYFVDGALRHGRDRALEEALAPCSTEEEFPGLVWKERTETRQPEEKPDPTCPDHGLDCVRYAAMFKWGKDLTPPHTDPAPEPGSFGDLLGHQSIVFTDDAYLGDLR